MALALITAPTTGVITTGIAPAVTITVTEDATVATAAEAEAEAEAEAGAESGTEMNTKAEAGAETGTEAGTDTEAEAEAGTNAINTAAGKETGSPSQRSNSVKQGNNAAHQSLSPATRTETGPRARTTQKTDDATAENAA